MKVTSFRSEKDNLHLSLLTVNRNESDFNEESKTDYSQDIKKTMLKIIIS